MQSHPDLGRPSPCTASVTAKAETSSVEGRRVSDVVFRSVFVSESCCVCSSVAVVWGQRSEWRRPVWVGDGGLRLASPTAAVLLAPSL